MAIFSSSQPSLRARILPRFPAQVIAGTGMTITKTGGTYTFAATTVGQSVATDTLLGRDTDGTGLVESIQLVQGLQFTGGGSIGLTANQRTRSLTTQFTGAPITTGIKADLFVPFSCTITRWTLIGDTNGSIVVDIWKDTYGAFPPTVADTITAAAKPTISANDMAQSSTLTGWTTTITANDVLRFNVDSVATFARMVIALDVLVT